MLLTRYIAGILCLGLTGQDFVSAKSKGKLPVSLKEKWRGRCKDVKEKSYRRKQYIDDGCYRYTCGRKARFVAWVRSDLSFVCCFLGTEGYENGTIISNTTSNEGCIQTIKVCSFEEQQGVIETRTTPLCCPIMGRNYPIGATIDSDACSKYKHF